KLLQPVWEGEQTLTAVSRPGEDSAEEPEEVARGFESTVTETATIAGQTLSWTERRLVVCSLGQARRQAAALDQRIERATAELEGLNRRKQGKKLLTARPLRAKAKQILARPRVAHLIAVRVQTIQTQRPRRRYGDRPAGVVVLRQVRVRVQVDQAAVALEKRQYGWRVYVTNQPGLPLDQAVLAYRGQ